jgi:hypothetical protein
VPVKELFEYGIALDGTQATFAVTGEKSGKAWIYYGPFVASRREAIEALQWVDGGSGSLPDAILQAEEGLVKFLEEYGYTVEFA